MGHLKTQVFASGLLASVAPEASNVLLRVAIDNKSGLVGQIATLLSYIADGLSKQELPLPPDTQCLSLQALQDLVDIYNWPTLPMLSTPGCDHHSTKSPQELRDLFGQMFKAEKSKDGVQSIKKFCKEKPDTIEPFRSRFMVLSDKLTEDTQRYIPAYPHVRPLAEYVYPDTVNKLLLDGIRSSASCVQDSHRTSIENDMHITRLCLNSGFRSENQHQLALFNIITATSEMTYWQELEISVPIKEIEEKDAQGLKKCKKVAVDSSKLSLVERGGACNWLQNPNYAKIHLDC